MSRASALNEAEIRRAVTAVLGEARVRSVRSAFQLNDDGAEIIRVHVVYEGPTELSVADMDRVVDALWKGDETAPFPVVDFKESSSLETAAE